MEQLTQVVEKEGLSAIRGLVYGSLFGLLGWALIVGLFCL